MCSFQPTFMCTKPFPGAKVNKKILNKVLTSVKLFPERVVWRKYTIVPESFKVEMGYFASAPVLEFLNSLWGLGTE